MRRRVFQLFVFLCLFEALWLTEIKLTADGWQLYRFSTMMWHTWTGWFFAGP